MLTIDQLCQGVDADLHPAVRALVPEAERLANLAEELTWWVEVAAGSLSWAEDYARHQPVEGLDPEDYRDRWIRAGDGLVVLAGPRFRARDPNRPFVGVVGANRPVTEADLPTLCEVARATFAGFHPRYLNL
ncbi:MAG: hypothetical protein ACRD0J_09575, partial [Acidimicrobiales bacterium]